MKVTRKNYPFDAIYSRIKNKTWSLEIKEVEEKSKNYIDERLIKNQDIFHIIVENGIILNGENVLNCLVKLIEINDYDKIKLMEFNNHTLNIIEINLD